MIALSMVTRNARLQAIIDAIGADGELLLYDGVRPATGGLGTTLLATLPLLTIAGTVNNAELTFNPISDDTSADAESIVSWGRLITSIGTFVVDFDCGGSASSAELKFANTSFVIGDRITIISFKIYEGNE